MTQARKMIQSLRSIPLILAATLVLSLGVSSPDTLGANAPGASELEMRQSISQYGITWTFAEKVPVGRFVTDDYYVVGPVTIVSVDPAPSGDGKKYRNGSMLNPPTTMEHGYDNRISHFNPALTAQFPVKMKPGDSLISVISLWGHQQNEVLANPTRRSEYTPLKTAAVLTCLSKQVPADAFRPAYCDRQKRKIHLARHIQWDKLPRVKPASWAPSFKSVERMFDRPWIDHIYDWGSRELHPSENMPGYSREIGRAVSMAALLLCCDYPMEKKEKLCRDLIQVGIDNWAIAKTGVRGSAGGWPAAGGFGNGRKLPIVFAGVMLNDSEMQNIKKYAPEASFGEDEHVEFGPSWTGAKVRFTGQYPLRGHIKIDRGPYEHLHPSQWPGNKKTMSEGYRRCCTSIAWVGQALAMRLMKAEKYWDHDAFFAYVDRWMYEDDDPFFYEIRSVYPRFKMKTIRQGTTHFDPWIDRMWKAHRETLDAPIDSWK